MKFPLKAGAAANKGMVEIDGWCSTGESGKGRTDGAIRIEVLVERSENE